jgi:hypothetical protein
MSNPNAILQLFLHPHSTYSVDDAADLLDVDAADLRKWIASGELEGVETAEGLVVPRAELVSFGMEIWDQEDVEDALGGEVDDAIPELLRLTEMEVRIPRLEVVALERLAAADGRSVSAVLARELRDLVSANAEWLAREVPGFAQAMQWPG